MYDMCKALDKGIEIREVVLRAKVGRQERRLPEKREAKVDLQQAESSDADVQPLKGLWNKGGFGIAKAMP